MPRLLDFRLAGRVFGRSRSMQNVADGSVLAEYPVSSASARQARDFGGAVPSKPPRAGSSPCGGSPRGRRTSASALGLQPSAWTTGLGDRLKRRPWTWLHKLRRLWYESCGREFVRCLGALRLTRPSSAATEGRAGPPNRRESFRDCSLAAEDGSRAPAHDSRTPPASLMAFRSSRPYHSGSVVPPTRRSGWVTAQARTRRCYPTRWLPSSGA